MKNNTEQFGHIGVLMGGYSSEREISLKSGKAVSESLQRQGFEVSSLDIVERQEERIKDFIARAHLDAAFIALHGRLGEDGTIQTILDDLNIPYPGSGARASRLALDKAAAQDLFKKNGLNVPPYVTLCGREIARHEDILRDIDFFPVVVKPACEGSSIGITLVRERECLGAALRQAFEYGDKVLIEQYIQGKELTVGILEERPLPPVEIRHRRAFFDFTAKYSPGMTEYIVPAQISQESCALLQKAAAGAHRVLGCEDLSRVDFILSDEGTYYILEVNTIPGFTATSLLPKAARAAGIEFDQLCVRLMKAAYGKKKRVKNITSG